MLSHSFERRAPSRALALHRPLLTPRWTAFMISFRAAAANPSLCMFLTEDCSARLSPVLCLPMMCCFSLHRFPHTHFYGLWFLSTANAHEHMPGRSCAALCGFCFYNLSVWGIRLIGMLLCLVERCVWAQLVSDAGVTGVSCRTPSSLRARARVSTS